MAKGTIFKFHNDLDTDQIIASQYLLLPNLEEMKEHAFESLDPDFPKKVKPWLWFFQRAGTRCFKGIRRTGYCCKVICKNFLQKRYQHRTSCYCL